MERILYIVIWDKNNKSKLYTIYETNKIEGKEGYLGYIDYDKQQIVLEKVSREKRIETLKHELAHAWLHENGYDQDRMYNIEEICDIIAYCNNCINVNVDKYIQAKEWFSI